MFCCLVLSGHNGFDKVKLPTLQGAGEVLVWVRACSLNFSDLMGCQGLYDRKPSPSLTTLGMNCSSTVEQLGEGVTDRKIMHVRFSDRINNYRHPRKQRRQPATKPLTQIPLKMSARADAKKEVGSNRP
ncbi:hypothetical protein NDU88_006455 [Pleurodeles waltl]|uniref:Alcohol dehydrogenase-like N-terminal domain-containing protein n=1 Tax=Pleurodeles waltl TaxID=8319 RepID=A0AAV7TE00_PLEWA|nr:hypothetical protein NDU88_006455 [Pleurodeles waltl]